MTKSKKPDFHLNTARIKLRKIIPTMISQIYGGFKRNLKILFCFHFVDFCFNVIQEQNL